MPKNSFEEYFPWTAANKWGLTLSSDTMRWVTKAFDEGFIESKADLDCLVDFNATLDNTFKKLSTQQTQAQQQQGESAAAQSPQQGQHDQSATGAAAAPPTSPSRAGIAPLAGPNQGTQNRMPHDQYEELRASGDAIALRCKIWVGMAGEDRGKLGAVCRRYLYMGGYTEPAAVIQEYANLEESKKSLMAAATNSGKQSPAERKRFCDEQVKKVEEREAALRRALRDNSEKWLYIMPLRAAGPTTQTRAEEEPPRQDAAHVHTPTDVRV